MENVKTDMHSVSCNYVLRTQNLIMIEHKVSGIQKKKKGKIHVIYPTQIVESIL